MAIPELLRHSAVTKGEAFCRRRVPDRYHADVRLEVGVRGNAVTIVERRPPWCEGIGSEWSSRKIAQMRYDSATSAWTLYWADRNGRWLRYPDADPSRSVDALIEAIDRDRAGAFFG